MMPKYSIRYERAGKTITGHVTTRELRKLLKDSPPESVILTKMSEKTSTCFHELVIDHNEKFEAKQ